MVLVYYFYSVEVFLKNMLLNSSLLILVNQKTCPLDAEGEKYFVSRVVDISEFS